MLNVECTKLHVRYIFIFLNEIKSRNQARVFGTLYFVHYNNSEKEDRLLSTQRHPLHWW
jgi:hypothetical protein